MNPLIRTEYQSKFDRVLTAHKSLALKHVIA